MGEPLFGLNCHVTLGTRKTSNIGTLIDAPWQIIKNDYKRFSSPPFTIEFESEFATSGKPNMATVRLYNPSQATIDAASVKTDVNGRRIPPYPIVLVDAGYGLDIGQVIVGEAYTSNIKRTAPDVILEFKVSDATAKWRESWVSKTYAKFSDAKEILYDITESVGVTPYSIRLGQPRTFEKPISFNESLTSAIARMCKETKSKYFISQGRFVVEPIDDPGKKTLVLLSPETGLIGSPERTDKGIKCQCLFNYRLGAGDTIALRSRDIQGNYRIFRGKHSVNEITGTTDLEMTKVNI